VPEDEQGYETVFGPDNPMPIDIYRKGLDVARSVCLLTTGQSYSAGTGFMMDGADLHPSLAGRAVLVTNEHVARRPGGEPGVRAEELVARFTAGGTPSPAEGIGGFTGVWWSPSTELDIALLVSPQLVSDSAPPLRPAAMLPMVRPGAHCYVVGHPGGGGLQLSIRGNELIDVDSERLHYRTPTSRGSSGSPVFDQDWELVGAHHRGSDALKALNGKPGQYEGNEGTTIRALVAQLAVHPPELGATA
jgi:Trypsin-like peptidase domain